MRAVAKTLLAATFLLNPFNVAAQNVEDREVTPLQLSPEEVEKLILKSRDAMPLPIDRCAFDILRAKAIKSGNAFSALAVQVYPDDDDPLKIPVQIEMNSSEKFDDSGFSVIYGRGRDPDTRQAYMTVNVAKGGVKVSFRSALLNLNKGKIVKDGDQSMEMFAIKLADNIIGCLSNGLR